MASPHFTVRAGDKVVVANYELWDSANIKQVSPACVPPCSPPSCPAHCMAYATDCTLLLAPHDFDDLPGLSPST